MSFLTLFFLLNPVPFTGQKYQKQKRPGDQNFSLESFTMH